MGHEQKEQVGVLGGLVAQPAPAQRCSALPLPFQLHRTHPVLPTASEKPEKPNSHQTEPEVKHGFTESQTGLDWKGA